MGAGKGIAGHGNGAPPQQTVQVQITRKIELLAANVEVVRLPNGHVVIAITDFGEGHVYTVQLTAEDARKIGAGMMSSVPTAGADEMPGGAK